SPRRGVGAAPVHGPRRRPSPRPARPARRPAELGRAPGPAPPVVSRMLWLALHFPDLSLEAFERAAPATPGTGAPLPLAICDHRNILLPNAPARAAGIAPGMRRASAQALLPTLRLIEDRKSVVEGKTLALLDRVDSNV